MVNETSFVAAAAALLVALPFVLAAPAAATAHHHTDKHGNHSHGNSSASEGGRGERAGAERPSRPPTHDGHNNADKLAAHPPVVPDPTTSTPSRTTSASDTVEAFVAHNKCKRYKHRRLLPWCTDPYSGWMGSTTLRGISNGSFTREMCKDNGYRPSVGCHSVRRSDLNEQ